MMGWQKKLRWPHLFFCHPTLKSKKMNFLERKKRLDYLLERIEKGQCISTNQMAQKFNCTKRTIKRVIEDSKKVERSKNVFGLFNH
jgi:DNA invertase Pin-like site-specific DNA recombinase